jgi:hypothetical protein
MSILPKSNCLIHSAKDSRTYTTKETYSNKGRKYKGSYQNVTFPLLLNLDPKEFIGLSIDAGVIVPSFDPKVEVIVPAREDTTEPLLIDSKASARSKTLPLNMPLYVALCGVEGTVACTAGPSAAL